MRRLSKALARSGIDADPLRNEQLLRQLATRRQAAVLATIDLPGRWTPPAGQPFGPPAEQPDHSRAGADERADGEGRAEGRARQHPSNPGDEEPRPGARPNPTSHSAPERSARSAPEQTARPNRTARPQVPTPPPTGSDAHTPPAKRRPPKSKRAGGKLRATNNILRDYAHRLLDEHGRLSRDLLEEVVRGDGYTVASDDAGVIVREIKAGLSASRHS